MKRFVVLLAFLFCGFAFADTINLHWLNEDETTYENSTCTIDGDLNIPTTPPTKYGYTFTGWKFAKYQPIEYLESTGTQYIDTGYVHDRNTRIAFSLKTKIPDYISGGEQEIIGGGDAGNGFNIWLDGQGIKCYNSPWRSTEVSTLYLPVNTNEIVEFNGWFDTNGFYCDFSNSPKTGYSYNTPQSRNIFLFARPGSPAFNYYPGKIYYVKLYDNNILVRDFIPVLDENNVPCMYDRVTKQFYYNQGTDQFIAGPAL